MDKTNPATAGLVRWDQQQAKAKFAEVIRGARSEGPQLVTTRVRRFVGTGVRVLNPRVASPVPGLV